jgi:hypothetical protein
MDNKKADLRRLFCWVRLAYFFAGSAAGAEAGAIAASAAGVATGAASGAGAGAATGAGASAGVSAGFWPQAVKDKANRATIRAERFIFYSFT